MTSPEPSAAGLRTRRTRRNPLAAAGVYLLLIIGAVITLGPFVLSLNTSLKSARQFATNPPLSPAVPPTLENYVQLLGRDFVTPLAVTAQMTLVLLVGQLFFSILAAYAFARMRFPGRELLFWLYLATLMVPQVVTVIPLYTMFSEIGLRNTFWGLVLPYVFGSPYAVFLLREYFRGIPQDIVDAARIDGASTWRIIWQIVVPLARPIISTLAIITVVSQWNTFLWPFIITTGPTWQTITVATDALRGQYNANWTLVMAATTIAMAPLLVIFTLFQRRIIDSIQLTGLK
ncbi:carbohydrate ABC transporter permease [Naumannella halotolerans]|uniref:Multiple sugar transport system permease protein n=1 Tax=Naumannella halotolerans TaxID=993414 RepID=A0A4R7J997_9ACTN|nr:carbohydrate ABC transporter permease [Naumannella halotolerans]TDT33905.1 multiple sugar transport system permease protein [Naumannella halotolerans]